MSNVKFRAWDKDYEKMMKIHSIVFHEHELIIDCYDEKDNETWLAENNERVVLMQYTGFDDRNGEPIYEGDILEYTTKSMIVNVEVYKSVTSLYRIRGKKIYPKELYSSRSNVRVIGNIYENPKLIN